MSPDETRPTSPAAPAPWSLREYWARSWAHLLLPRDRLLVRLLRESEVLAGRPDPGPLTPEQARRLRFDEPAGFPVVSDADRDRAESTLVFTARALALWPCLCLTFVPVGVAAWFLQNARDPLQVGFLILLGLGAGLLLGLVLTFVGVWPWSRLVMRIGEWRHGERFVRRDAPPDATTDHPGSATDPQTAPSPTGAKAGSQGVGHVEPCRPDGQAG